MSPAWTPVLLGAQGTGFFDAVVEGFRSNRALAGKIALISLAVAIGYAALMFVALSRMEADYFVVRRPTEGTWRDRHPVVRAAVHVTKNVLGLLLLLTGLAMLVLPGQGALTILVGLSLLDFPGKRRLLLRIVRERHVYSAINWIRARAHQPPIVLPDNPEGDP
jgi:UPF0716 family protein affecting phage T7 exclusion